MTGPALETLPADVLILILSALPDRQSLKAAVHASPTLHRVYLAARYSILLSLLHTQHGGLVIESDAIAAVRSEYLYAGIKDNRKHITALLDCRRRELCAKPADANEVAQLLRLHELATWFVEDLSKTMNYPGSWWPKDSRPWNARPPLELSDEEKRRVFRGFYRLQIWCNIFGGSTRDRQYGVLSNGVFESQEVFRLFLFTMPPWEIDQMGCVFLALRTRLDLDWEDTVTTYSLYTQSYQSLDDLESDTWSTEGQFSQDESNALSSVVDQGPAWIHTLNIDADPTVTHFEKLLENEKELAVDPIEDFPRKWPLVYPADRYNAETLDEFNQILDTLPVKKRPAPCWKHLWNQVPNVCGSYLHDVLLCGFRTDRWI